MGWIMQWYEQEVSELESRFGTPLHQKGVNLFYGSSSLRLWENIQSDLHPYEIANNAFGGSTFEACAHYFDRLILPMEPKSIILYAGDNDLGDGRGSCKTQNYFNRFYYKLRHHFPAIPFTYISIKPSPSRWRLQGAIEEVNGYIQIQMENRENCHFVDIYFDMLKDGEPNREYYSDDLLHMSPEGYALWGKKLRQYGEKIFL